MNELAVNKQQRKRVRLWQWFLIGFVIVFVAALLTVNTEYVDGNVIVGCKLWRYYAVEIPRVFELRPVGLGSNASPFTNLFEHTLMATAGGLVTLGVGAAVSRMFKW